MTAWICATCGVQYPPSGEPPSGCPICEDPRQYVGHNGQKWTTLDEIRAKYSNEIQEHEPGVVSIHSTPSFGIAQYAYLVSTSEGNLLWDCLTLLDDATVDQIPRRGGVRAIAISHPHYYSTMIEWSEAFDGAPVYIHADDREWVVRSGPHVELWQGESKPLFGDITLIRSGGHFAGFQVAHWTAGANGRGVLFAGDQPQVCLDRRWVSFLWSYPNMIPFDAPAIRRITRSLAPWGFDRIYGAFGRNVMQDAKEVIARSEARYLKAIGAQ